MNRTLASCSIGKYFVSNILSFSFLKSRKKWETRKIFVIQLGNIFDAWTAYCLWLIQYENLSSLLNIFNKYDWNSPPTLIVFYAMKIIPTTANKCRRNLDLLTMFLIILWGSRLLTHLPHGIISSLHYQENGFSWKIWAVTWRIEWDKILIPS